MKLMREKRIHWRVKLKKMLKDEDQAVDSDDACQVGRYASKLVCQSL